MRSATESEAGAGLSAWISGAIMAVVTPGRYFRRRSPNLPVKPALVSVLIAAALSTVVSAIAIWVIISKIPPGATFEVGGEIVPARSAAWDTARRLLGYRVPGTFLAWVAMVAAVHFGSLLDASEGDVTDSAAVASWAMVPLSVEGIIRGLVLAGLLGATEPASSLEALERQISTAVAGVQGPANVVLQVFGGAWMGYVVFQGLRHGRGLRRDGAALVGGSLSLLVVVLGLV